MGKKLLPAEMELYRRVDEVLHYLWDPIGIAGEPAARNEYQEYLPRIFLLLKTTEDGSEIEKYLAWARIERMGLSADPESEKKIARILIRHRNDIADRYKSAGSQ